MPAVKTDIVQVEGGFLHGSSCDGMDAYLGIRYAAPPVDGLRWKPPQPAADWPGVLECTSFGNDSLQNADLGVFARAGGDEDCLFLNIFTPHRPSVSHARLPVMVWIHGGATRVGSSRDYDPARLVRDGGVIVVTINYRLGILGYFAHPELESEGEGCGNFGLLDQQCALGWVKRNIAAFGGDPANVTIFGESAGGASVIGQLVSPGAAGLFDRAIVMSGGATILKWPVFGAPIPLELAFERGQAFMHAAGCRTLAQLREARPEDLLAVQTPFVGANQFILDGTTIPVHPAEAFRAGQFNRVEILFGHTTEEGAFFSGLIENESGLSMTGDTLESEVAFMFGPLGQRVLAEYTAQDYDNAAERFAAIFTDYMFAVTDNLLLAWSGEWTMVYGYEFADRTAPSYLQPTTFPVGAGHTCELPYLFRNFHGAGGIRTELNALQDRLSERMIAYWSEFARTGRPSNDWPPYNQAEDNLMLLALPEPRMASGRTACRHRSAFWMELGIFA